MWENRFRLLAIGGWRNRVSESGGSKHRDRAIGSAAHRNIKNPVYERLPDMKFSRRVAWIAMLPVLHLALCAATAIGMNAGPGWEWFGVMFVDLPIVYLLPFISSWR